MVTFKFDLTTPHCRLHLLNLENSLFFTVFCTSCIATCRTSLPFLSFFSVQSWSSQIHLLSIYLGTPLDVLTFFPLLLLSPEFVFSDKYRAQLLGTLARLEMGSDSQHTQWQQLGSFTYASRKHRCLIYVPNLHTSRRFSLHPHSSCQERARAHPLASVWFIALMAR